MNKGEKKTRMAIIAGAASALRYKDKHPKAPEQEIIQHVTNNADDILNKIDINED
jgi:hypothetical protein